MNYPLFFEPVYQERIWGGNAFETHFGRDLQGKKMAESWEITCHDHGMGVISNGALKGMDLRTAMMRYPLELLGEALQKDEHQKFPLLIKLLDAADILSVQVHPDDTYAALYAHGELGKTEMWYVMAAQPGAKLICGVKPGVDKERFARSLQAGSLEECLHEVLVKEGDVVYIPAGLLHAIGAGIMICEIQQNSDTTYRVYDFNRKDNSGSLRELHLDKAMDVIDFSSRISKEKLAGLTLSETGGRRTYYVACRYFAMEKLEITGEMTDGTDGKRFCTLTCVKGAGTILYSEAEEPIRAGQSCLMPASVDTYKLRGSMEVIKAYVPDRQENIIKPLCRRGLSNKQLMSIAGLLDE